MELTTTVLTVDAATPAVVRLTLDSAGRRNRLDDELLQALSHGIETAERTAGARALVIDARGDAFCSGLSVGDLDTADWRARIAAVEAVLRRLTASPLVTVAMVDGVTTGGGVGLAAACDLVIAGPRARFRLTEVLLGLVPAIILPVLARRIGAHRAYSLALTAREIDGFEAYRLGLADQSPADPAGALRQVLVGVRRADEAALRAVKRFYTGHLAAAAPSWEPAAEVLAGRFADPAVRDRLATFRREGLIP